MAKSSIKVITDEFVISYPNVFKPRKNKKGEDKYSAACVFLEGKLGCTLPDGTRTTLDKVALDVAKEAFGPQAAEKIRKEQLKWPFNNGEKKDYPEGSIYFNASSNQQPGAVGPYRDPSTGKPRVITDPKDIYPGAICRASLTCYDYDNESKGVTFGLNHIQKLRDGDRLDGRKAAEDTFSADDEALADLGDVTGEDEETEEAAPPPPVKKAAKAGAKKGSSVLDQLQ